jgi:hypothetical protein
VLLALVLCIVGALGGIVIGLGLRPPPAGPVETAVGEPQVPAPPASPPATAALPDTSGMEAQLATLRRAVEQEQVRLDALIRSRSTAEAEQQARLEALTRARAAAETQLAALQRDIAAAQREAAAMSRREAAAPPPIAGPAPAPMPAPARPAREAPATGGQPRVFVHHRTGSAAGAEAAAALVAPLREGGFEVPEARPVPAVPSQRVVRYFHGEDAAAAARLAGRLGRGWAIQDFRGYEPSPGPGTLEVWVPDR